MSTAEANLDTLDLMIAAQMLHHVLLDARMILSQLIDPVSILTLQASIAAAILVEILVAHGFLVALQFANLDYRWVIFGVPVTRYNMPCCGQLLALLLKLEMLRLHSFTLRFNHFVLLIEFLFKFEKLNFLLK